ncbi:MAG: PilZ domain-containing protein [Deltaproteobacteria bacterium]|nr:PilZ domain-containing protein [Deltaproteobacteria bacterium]MBW2070037.1 PilZ domain-containing protein [Deltaproteobacteria bacterium]
MSHHGERRRYPRAYLDCPALVQGPGGAKLAEAGNISARGAFIRCEEPLFPEDRVKLHIMVPDRLALSVDAKVAWLQVRCAENNSPRCGIGISFTQISETDRKFIIALASGLFPSGQQG